MNILILWFFFLSVHINIVFHAKNEGEKKETKNKKRKELKNSKVKMYIFHFYSLSLFHLHTSHRPYTRCLTEIESSGEIFYFMHIIRPFVSLECFGVAPSCLTQEKKNEEECNKKRASIKKTNENNFLDDKYWRMENTSKEEA